MPRLQRQMMIPVFCDNKLAAKAPDDYVDVCVFVDRVLESWKDSILSFEFLNSDGSLRGDRELSPKNMDRRLVLEQKIKEKKTVEKPILGIGLMDNVEIGSGRDIFMTLAFHGHTTIDAHIRKNQQADFKGYIV